MCGRTPPPASLAPWQRKVKKSFGHVSEIRLQFSEGQPRGTKKKDGGAMLMAELCNWNMWAFLELIYHFQHSKSQLQTQGLTTSLPWPFREFEQKCRFRVRSEVRRVSHFLESRRYRKSPFLFLLTCQLEQSEVAPIKYAVRCNFLIQGTKISYIKVLRKCRPNSRVIRGTLYRNNFRSAL